MNLKYLFVVLSLSCLLMISSCSGNNDQETIILEESNPPHQVADELDKNVIPEENKKKKSDSANRQVALDIVKLDKNKDLEGGICVDDFNSGSKPNCLGGDLGAFDFMPNDFSQSCLEAYDPGMKMGDSGFSMRLDYDVDSTNPAFNGFWTKLNNFDASHFSKLIFWVKGDQEYGFTDVFKVELKNASGETGKYYIHNVSAEWQMISISLSDFAVINDFSDLVELIFVFEDRIASNKEGTIWVDDIFFVE
ncbi:MAG: carbohydrate binding domain-containing protein [Candidatus Kappaea frigidicola]|nr:carbohydrate binding domain-containing protein [Candidatus Kappaea frigidicola]